MHLNKTFKPALALFAVVATFVFVSQLQAANRNWTGLNNNNDWRDPLNWSGSKAPTVSDNSYIRLDFNGVGTTSTVPVLSSGSVAIGALSIGVDGGYGELHLTGSGQMSTGSVQIGRHTGGGTLIISGNSSFMPSNYIRTGAGPSASYLEVSENGSIIAANHLDGGWEAGSTTQIVVRDNAIMTFERSINIGRDAHVVMTVSGSAYVASKENLIIGHRSTGTVVIQDDAVIRNPITIIGNEATGNGTLYLKGGFIETANIARVSGSATLVLNGGGIRAIANISDFFGNFDALTITGTGIAADKSAFTVDTAGFEVTITNTLAFIGEDDTVALDKIGEGTLILNARSPLHGTTRISGGILKAGNMNILTSSRMVIGSGGVFDMDGLNQTIKGLENYGEVRFSTDRNNVGRTLIINGNLSGSGTFAMSVRLGNEVTDSVTVTGVATGTHTLALKNLGGVIDPESRLDILTLDHGGTAVIKSNDVDGGMGTYSLTPEIDPDTGATIYGLTATGNNSIAANAIFATAASLGTEWHFGLDSVRNRFGEIRALEKTDEAFTSTWYQGSAYRLETESPLVTIAYDQNTYGGAFGVDRVIPITNARVLLGAYFSLNRSDRTYDVYGDGNTIDHCGGLYVTWLHDTGWFADFIAKADHYKNSFSVIASDSSATSADYSNYGVGFSMEFGRKFKFGQRFWVEPSVQLASAWFNPVDYTTSTKIKVGIDRGNATQYRGQVALGWRLGTRWYPYFRAGAVRSNNSGGAVHAEKQSWETQYSGWRFEAGGGLAVAITDRNLLYLEYEYANADLYTRPWAVNLGYRRTW